MVALPDPASTSEFPSRLLPPHRQGSQSLGDTWQFSEEQVLAQVHNAGLT